MAVRECIILGNVLLTESSMSMNTPSSHPANQQVECRVGFKKNGVRLIAR